MLGRVGTVVRWVGSGRRIRGVKGEGDEAFVPATNEIARWQMVCVWLTRGR